MSCQTSDRRALIRPGLLFAMDSCASCAASTTNGNSEVTADASTDRAHAGSSGGSADSPLAPPTEGGSPPSSSPFSSARDIIAKNIKSATGFDAHAFQLDVGANLHAGHDVLLLAGTASGKTLAIAAVLFMNENKSIILLAPLNELEKLQMSSLLPH